LEGEPVLAAVFAVLIEGNERWWVQIGGNAVVLMGICWARG
jgi:hypothetical protein